MYIVPRKLTLFLGVSKFLHSFHNPFNEGSDFRNDFIEKNKTCTEKWMTPYLILLVIYL